MTPADFVAWRHRLPRRKNAPVSQSEAGRLLGVSLRQVQAYEAGEKPVPVTVALACEAIATRAMYGPL